MVRQALSESEKIARAEAQLEKARLRLAKTKGRQRIRELRKDRHSPEARTLRAISSLRAVLVGEGVLDEQLLRAIERGLEQLTNTFSRATGIAPEVVAYYGKLADEADEEDLPFGEEEASEPSEASAAS